MYKFKASIKLSNGLRQDVTVEADNAQKARLMIEAQYGSGCIVNSPNRVY